MGRGEDSVLQDPAQCGRGLAVSSTEEPQELAFLGFQGCGGILGPHSFLSLDAPELGAAHCPTGLLHLPTHRGCLHTPPSQATLTGHTESDGPLCAHTLSGEVHMAASSLHPKEVL
eukprot:NP_001243724.1 uncharacterized protein LOC100129083 [Homo sapiens]